MAYLVARSLCGAGYGYGTLNPHLATSLPLTTWQQLTWLDRLSGGSTFMVHSPGTRPPNTHPVPEEARLDVFLPLVLLKEYPELGPVFAQLVQSYAQHVATVTMERWDRAKGLNLGGALHQADVPRTPSGRQRRTALIPEGSTPYRVFHGRPVGELEQLLAQTLGEATALSTSLARMRFPTTPPTSSKPTTSASTTQSVNSPPNSSDAEYISPPGMPHIKLQYNPGDPWSRTDLVEWAKQEAASPGGMTSTGHPSDLLVAKAEMRRIVNGYEAHIEHLEEIVRSQQEEINGLKELLKSEGMSLFLRIALLYWTSF